MPLSPMHLICIDPTPLLNASMHPTLVINTHTRHQSLTYSFPSTRDPYSPHKLFTYSSASVCANNGEIIMWACLWVRVRCVSVLCTSVVESMDCYKSYLPLIPQKLHALHLACSSSSLWKALCSPYSSYEVAQTRGHVIEARC